MDLISRLRNAKLNVKNSNNPEIAALKKTNLTSTLNRGFTEVYRANPSDPVEFLSKWLYKESKANELRARYAEDKRKRDNARQRYKERKLKEQEQQSIKNEQAQQHINKQNALLTTIDTCESHWITFNEVCERLKSLVKASGCYLAVYDLRRKEVTEEDDETGHIHPSNTNVIRYIAWCDDHAFLHGQCLEPNTGVTYNLLLPRQTQVNPNPQGEGGDNAQEEGQQAASQQVHRDERKEEAEGIESLLISDVINDNRIKFYKEPRLGCYYAVDITYKSSLSYASLKSAMQATKQYLENKEKQDQRYKEWKEKKEQKEKELEELRKQAEKEAEEKRKEEEAANAEKDAQGQAQDQAQEGNADAKKQEPEQQPQQSAQDQQQQPTQEQLALESEIEEWKEEPVKLADYDKEDKKLILCLDTLGQDRVFTGDEFKYIIDVCKSIKTSLENYERRLLEKDRDSKIKFDESETKLRAGDDFDEEKFYENADNAIAAYYETDEFKELKLEEGDPRRVIEGNIAKAKYIKSQLLEGSVLELLTTFAEWEFIEYEKVFQNLFYFAQAEPILINEPETNKIEWKRARKYWKDVFPYICNYNPRGAKPDRLRNIHKLNKIKENLEYAIAKREEVKSYSYTLLLLVDYVLLLIKIRYDDIVQRTEEVTAFKAAREQIIKENEEIEVERNKIIEEAKQAEEAQRLLQQQQQQVAVGESAQNQAGQEQQQQEGQEGEKPSEDNGLEEILRKFDEEYPKKEVPEDRDYDYDFDYDIK